MTRDEMIKLIIEERVHDYKNSDPSDPIIQYWLIWDLKNLFYEGLKGYKTQSDQEIRKAFLSLNPIFFNEKDGLKIRVEQHRMRVKKWSVN